MAFDGIVVANLVRDLKEACEGGRINKIAQPEHDELLITIKKEKTTSRLLISASASLPLLYLTDSNKPSPLTAPNFCMLLRKHIGSGRILSVSQPGLERVVEFGIEHLDEMGDTCRKRLIVELMGKHSNIIFCKEDGTILDSIKHVSAQVSSVREVLPGRSYFLPQTMDKGDPLTISLEEFTERMQHAAMPVSRALYSLLTGISPLMAQEIFYEAGFTEDASANELNADELLHLHHTLQLLMEDVAKGNFTPTAIYRKEEPVEFAALPLRCYSGGDYESREFSSISSLLIAYYSEKEAVTRIRQKSVDLRRIITTALERTAKKYELQRKQLRDTEKRETYRIRGELLNTYGYELTGGEKELRCLNYYTNEEVMIPLDPTLSARENAQRYFDRYAKLKRTYEALEKLAEESRLELMHLDSIQASLDIALKEEDLVPIKEELTEYGYIRRHASDGRKVKITSRPYHYRSSDGYDIYVGKNNYQNEELTFKVASGNDWWFHAKGIPGSHVIVKCQGREDLPDRVFEEAGALAAFYSRGKSADKVEIDYIQKKHLRKVAGAAPGYVIYHTNYSLVAEPSCDLEEVR